MDLVFPGSIAKLQDFQHESLHLFTDHQILIPFKESMGIQLNKDPFGPVLYADAGAAPTLQTIHR
jgi:hypothetical protein